MEQAETSTATAAADASRPPILSYYGPAIPSGDARPSYLIAAVCGLIALLLFSFGIYIVLDLTLGAVGTSGWVMISALAAPFCFLGGVMLISRVGRRLRLVRRANAEVPASQ
jgi:membrane associated rhomboid family serine protease